MNYPIPGINNNFYITIVKYPELSEFLIDITQPGISLAATEINYQGKKIKQPPRNVPLDIDEIVITFNLKEDYSNYYTIFNWMKSYKSAKKVEGLTSDIIIYHYNLLKLPVRKITLIDTFPTMLSDISLFANASDVTNVQFTTNFTINEIFIEEL